MIVMAGPVPATMNTALPEWPEAAAFMGPRHKAGDDELWV
jgi:hypothetical protein